MTTYLVFSSDTLAFSVVVFLSLESHWLARILWILLIRESSSSSSSSLTNLVTISLAVALAGSALLVLLASLPALATLAVSSHDWPPLLLLLLLQEKIRQLVNFQLKTVIHRLVNFVNSPGDEGGHQILLQLVRRLPATLALD